MGKCDDCKEFTKVYATRWHDKPHTQYLCAECIKDRKEAIKQAIRSTYGRNIKVTK